MSNAKRKSTYFSLPISKKNYPLSRNKTPLERHLEILEFLPKVSSVKSRSEIEILKDKHLFLREDDSVDWEERLAQKYYDQLFKEYCLSNLSRYKTGQIALRWRTREEVLAGKGQFTCGNLQCFNSEKLASFEVNFGYIEQGIKKNALVKLRLCEECGHKLNYKRKHSKKQSVSTVDQSDQTKQEETLISEQQDETIEVPIEKDEINEKESPERDSSFWSQNGKRDDVELSKEEEFDQYFADLLQ